MSILGITDECCDEVDCGLPGELVSLGFVCGGNIHLSFATYRCVNGHEWEDEKEADVVHE